MYSVLVVDSDATCLAIAKSALESWNYQVTTTHHPGDALCLLKKTSFDLVLADVRLPEMNGIQLLRCINKEYDIPVILMSEDVQTELIGEGLKNGAQTFLLKPILVDAVRDIWKFTEFRKVNKGKNTMTTSYPAKVPTNIGSSFGIENVNDKPTNKTSKNIAWTPRLHTRFVEVLLITGYHKAIPKTILEVMNAPEVTREQVASHLQKYRKFVKGVLDGRIRFESSKYCTNYNYTYSSIVGGNPNLFLINQLREERRIGRNAAPISASLPLPRFNQTPGSSSMRPIMNAMSMPTNYASSSRYSKIEGIGGGSATFQKAGNINLGNIVGSNSITFGNSIQNMNYKANDHMGYYNQNSTVVPQKNNNFTNEGSVGGANFNNWFPSTNLVQPSSTRTESIQNNFIYEQSVNLGAQGNTIIFNVNNFNGIQMGDMQPHRYTRGSFGENHLAYNLGKDEQLRAMQTDPNTTAGSLGTNQFGNTMTMNEQMGYIQPAHPNIGTSFAGDQYGYTSSMNMNKAREDWNI